jgi:hypothetical protein
MIVPFPDRRTSTGRRRLGDHVEYSGERKSEIEYRSRLVSGATGTK